jgi:hypothetical protein
LRDGKSRIKVQSEIPAMKKFLLLLLLPSFTTTAVAGAGPGPWSLGASYPGQLDGKYQAAVYGNNITGVVGFALINGAPPFDERTGIAGAAAAGGAGGAGGGAGGAAGAPVNTDLGLDETQNYFAIFVQGRTYTGRTVGMVDIDRHTVTATMIGAQPSFEYAELSIGQSVAIPGAPPTVVESQTDVPILNNLPLINRGLSGGFKANLKTKSGGSVTTFKGSGQLSTPAQTQTVNAQPDTFPIPDLLGGPPLLITGFTPATLVANIITESVPFDVYGIKTSVFSSNPLQNTNAAAQ